MTHTQKTRRLVVAASALLLVLLAGVGAVLWNDFQRSKPQFQQAQADAHSIRIQRKAFADIVMQLDAAGLWSITEPCSLPVNPQRMQPLLDALQPAAQSFAAADVDLEAAGLLDPEAVIVMNEQALALGITDLSGERRYLQRGERIEFVPEWILSLVNGGLSALASLDVFPQPLDELVLLPEQPTELAPEVISVDELAQWQALSAQQIVTWPLQDSEPATASRSLRAKIGDQQLSMSLHLYPRYAAVRYENAHCAFLISTDSLPDTAQL
ncbi:hypothetical protein [Granulosicoccus antarcticus]|uniref:hypothetical protein n=1 Tax=Granulosicoccus antarcticus TaxID=437505 RepID=UPI0012FD0063|nr:hypothetical protein [Granulosicoccus antarcticus]